MNTKVTQMIELLFRDVQPSEEVQALRDEVMNNCQERFEDLIRSGLSEEEALAAVMESLKGMEDVLREYPRKEEETLPETAAAEKASAAAEKDGGQEQACFPPETVKAIQVQLAGCRVEVEQAGDEVILEKQGKVHWELEADGTLRIWQERAAENLFRGISWENSVSSFEHFGDALNRLAQNLTEMISGKIGEIGGNPETRLLIRLPESFHPEVNIHTMSGSVSWRDAAPGGSFALGTTSGDILVRINQEILLKDAEITSTSGAAELHMSAETARVTTVSGNILWDGDAGVLDMNSTSGAVSAGGRIRMANLKSTSGKLSLELADDLPAEVNANTVSGNIHLKLKGNRGEARARLSSVSGQIRTHGVDLSEDAPVTIEAGTVSGSLQISRSKNG